MTTVITLGNLITLIGLGLAIFGVFWRVSASSKAAAVIIAEIKSDTKYAREDHDKMISLEKDVQENKKDIQNQYNFIKGSER